MPRHAENQHILKYNPDKLLDREAQSHVKSHAKFLIVDRRLDRQDCTCRQHTENESNMNVYRSEVVTAKCRAEYLKLFHAIR